MLWDNAKIAEKGNYGGKVLTLIKAVTGDTVDPFKDTPSLNILIKLMTMVSG